MWSVVQCPRLECSKHMITSFGAKRKKCPYCGRSFKVDDNFVNVYKEQDQARAMVRIFNNRLRD